MTNTTTGSPVAHKAIIIPYYDMDKYKMVSVKIGFSNIIKQVLFRLGEASVKKWANEKAYAIYDGYYTITVYSYGGYIDMDTIYVFAYFTSYAGDDSDMVLVEDITDAMPTSEYIKTLTSIDNEEEIIEIKTLSEGGQYTSLHPSTPSYSSGDIKMDKNNAVSYITYNHDTLDQVVCPHVDMGNTNLMSISEYEIADRAFHFENIPSPIYTLEQNSRYFMMWCPEQSVLIKMSVKRKTRRVRNGNKWGYIQYVTLRWTINRWHPISDQQTKAYNYSVDIDIGESEIPLFSDFPEIFVNFLTTYEVPYVVISTFRPNVREQLQKNIRIRLIKPNFHYDEESGKDVVDYNEVDIRLLDKMIGVFDVYTDEYGNQHLFSIIINGTTAVVREYNFDSLTASVLNIPVIDTPHQVACTTIPYAICHNTICFMTHHTTIETPSIGDVIIDSGKDLTDTTITRNGFVVSFFVGESRIEVEQVLSDSATTASSLSGSFNNNSLVLPDMFCINNEFVVEYPQYPNPKAWRICLNSDTFEYVPLQRQSSSGHIIRYVAQFGAHVLGMTYSYIENTGNVIHSANSSDMNNEPVLLHMRGLTMSPYYYSFDYYRSGSSDPSMIGFISNLRNCVMYHASGGTNISVRTCMN